MDIHKKLFFYMNNNEEFIYLDDKNNIEKNFSLYNKKNETNLINELMKCNNVVEINKRNALHYYEKKKS